VLLEFEAGFDSKSRARGRCAPKVDHGQARSAARRGRGRKVLEVNPVALYPVLVVGLSGDVPERTLGCALPVPAKNAIEAGRPGVLSAELRGGRP